MTIPGEQGEFFTRAEKDEYDALKEGRHGLAESINATARTRDELAGQPGAVSTTRGAGEPDTGRVVPPRQPVSEAPEGEISEPGALAPTEVDKWAARAEGALGTAAISPKYGTVEGETPGVTPSAPSYYADQLIRVQNFRTQYGELRDELTSKIGRGVVTPMLQKIQRDFNELIDANADLIGNRELVQQLKNPVFEIGRAHV